MTGLQSELGISRGNSPLTMHFWARFPAFPLAKAFFAAIWNLFSDARFAKPSQPAIEDVKTTGPAAKPSQHATKRKA